MNSQNPLLEARYERLVQTLTTLHSTMQGSPAASAQAARWSQASAQLQQELHRVRSFASSMAAASPAAGREQSENAHAVLRRTAQRLTQLARTQDGLRFDHAEQLLSQRRSVVLAAWQLMQVLEPSPASGSDSASPSAPR